MLDDIYIFYLLSKYQLGFLEKKDLIIGIREYIIGKGQIFIKIIQLFLLNSYKWSYFTNDELIEVNKILDSVNCDVPEADFTVGSGSVAYVYIDKEDDNNVIKKTLPNIKSNISESISKFIKMINFSNLLGYDFIDISSIKDYENFLLKQVNLENEAKNFIKMKGLFENYKHVHLPKIHKYNEESICMERLEGLKMYDFINKQPDKKNEVESLMLLVITVMIKNKFIHGDIHEGNFLFYIKNNVVNVNILDLGIVIEINDKQKDIFFGYFRKDGNVVDFIYEMTDKKYSKDILENLVKDNPEIINRTNPLEVIKFLRKNNIKFQINFLTLFIGLTSFRLRLKNHL